MHRARWCHARAYRRFDTFFTHSCLKSVIWRTSAHTNQTCTRALIDTRTICAHTCELTRALSLSLSLRFSSFPSKISRFPFSLSRPLSLSLSLCLFLALALALFLSRSLALSPSYSFSGDCSLSLALSQFLSLTLSLALSRSLSLADSYHTHTYTHTTEHRSYAAAAAETDRGVCEGDETEQQDTCEQIFLPEWEEEFLESTYSRPALQTWYTPNVQQTFTAVSMAQTLSGSWLMHVRYALWSLCTPPSPPPFTPSCFSVMCRLRLFMFMETCLSCMIYLVPVGMVSDLPSSLAFLLLSI